MTKIIAYEEEDELKDNSNLYKLDDSFAAAKQIVFQELLEHGDQIVCKMWLSVI